MVQVKSQRKSQKRKRRHSRVRSKIFGTSTKPRLCVFRSNKIVYAQLIDDEKGVTLLSSDSRMVTGKSPLEKAHAVGAHIGKTALEKKLTEVYFDRGGFVYTGQVKAVAEGARQAGLSF